MAVNPYRIPAKQTTMNIRELFYLTPWNRCCAFMICVKYPNLIEITTIKTISEPPRFIRKYEMEPAIGRIAIFEPCLCDIIEVRYKAHCPPKYMEQLNA